MRVCVAHLISFFIITIPIFFNAYYLFKNYKEHSNISGSLGVLKKTATISPSHDSIRTLESMVRKSISAYSNSIADMNRQLSEARANLDKPLSDARDSLDKPLSEARFSLDGSLIDSYANLDGALSKARDNLDGTSSKAQDNLDGTSSKVGSSLDGISSKARYNLDGTSSKAQDSLDDTSSKARDSLDGIPSKAGDSLDGISTKARDNLGSTSSKARDSLDRTRTRSRDNLDDLLAKANLNHDNIDESLSGEGSDKSGNRNDRKPSGMKYSCSDSSGSSLLSCRRDSCNSSHRINYADEQLGATVRNVRAEPVDQSLLLSMLGTEHSTNPPINVLRSSMHPGNCYAFRNRQAELDIRLANEIYVDVIEMEHIPQCRSPTKDISSAPRNFRVFGIDCSGDEIYLGDFEFFNNSTCQLFELTVNQRFQVLRFKFESNHGNKAYTCLYRIAVYGHP